ncbi:hypothetical protein M885DRAFT_500074 [Pelagophyceae sp. CCMP2097]|nr:hypothetical protein M885DRAFT_500074 [Pelagophyceae sp. CCMP2097]
MRCSAWMALMGCAALLVAAPASDEGGDGMADASRRASAPLATARNAAAALATTVTPEAKACIDDDGGGGTCIGGNGGDDGKKRSYGMRVVLAREEARLDGRRLGRAKNWLDNRSVRQVPLNIQCSMKGFKEHESDVRFDCYKAINAARAFETSGVLNSNFGRDNELECMFFDPIWTYFNRAFFCQRVGCREYSHFFLSFWGLSILISVND